MIAVQDKGWSRKGAGRVILQVNDERGPEDNNAWENAMRPIAWAKKVE